MLFESSKFLWFFETASKLTLSFITLFSEAFFSIEDQSLTCIILHLKAIIPKIWIIVGFRSNHSLGVSFCFNSYVCERF